MPDKRRLVTSKVCFGSEKAGLLDNSYNKCALNKIITKFNAMQQFKWLSFLNSVLDNWTNGCWKMKKRWSFF